MWLGVGCWSMVAGFCGCLGGRGRGRPPCLLRWSLSECYNVMRELLAGDIEAGATHWPVRLRPALELPGFAAELRDLLLRAAEHGLGPEDLLRLGQEHSREEWVAAGFFGRQYEQVTLLGTQ